MNNETIINKLAKKFPQCWFKEIDGDITSGEEAIIDGLPAFNYNAWESDPNENIWTMGVNNDLIEFSGTFDMYWECQDPGTFKLYQE